jgi:hypothetical protein
MSESESVSKPFVSLHPASYLSVSPFISQSLHSSLSLSIHIPPSRPPSALPLLPLVLILILVPGLLILLGRLLLEHIPVLAL